MSLGLSNNNQETIEDEGRSSRNVLGRTDRQAGEHPAPNRDAGTRAICDSFRELMEHFGAVMRYRAGGGGSTTRLICLGAPGGG
jgi:hypothetical protein